MMGGFGGFGWIGMILNLVITVGVIVGLVLLVMWAVRRAIGSQTGMVNSGSLPAKDIAQARYAKGEISRDEYQQIISEIEK